MAISATLLQSYSVSVTTSSVVVYLCTEWCERVYGLASRRCRKIVCFLLFVHVCGPQCVVCEDAGVVTLHSRGDLDGGLRSEGLIEVQAMLCTVEVKVTALLTKVVFGACCTRAW